MFDHPLHENKEFSELLKNLLFTEFR